MAKATNSRPHPFLSTDKSRNARLLARYGITLAEYQTVLTAQAGVCAICHRPPLVRALNTDHDHDWRRVRVLKVKIPLGKARESLWLCHAEWRGVRFESAGRTVYEARREVIQQLRRASVRGLLCGRCNRGLQFFADNPDRLRAAADYVRRLGPIFIKPKTEHPPLVLPCTCGADSSKCPFPGHRPTQVDTSFAP